MDLCERWREGWMDDRQSKEKDKKNIFVGQSENGEEKQLHVLRKIVHNIEWLNSRELLQKIESQ